MRLGCETPVLPVRLGVEPYEPEQPVKADTGEQVSNLGWLIRAGRCACLGDEYRIGVNSRTAAMVGPNKEAKVQDG